MAQIAISLVLGLGSMLLSRLFQPKPKDVYGARVSDLNVPAVSPGNPVIRCWGTMRIPGQMIWSAPMVEHANVYQVGASKKSDGQKVTVYTYSVDVAYGVCKGPIKGIARIWANSKLLYLDWGMMGATGQSMETAYYGELDRLVNQEGMTNYDVAYCSAYLFAYNQFDTQGMVPFFQALYYIWPWIQAHPAPAFPDDVYGQIPPPTAGVLQQMIILTGGLYTGVQYNQYKAARYSNLTVYPGDYTQNPDPSMQASLGALDVPAYRGTAYVVINTLFLTDFGNRIPTVTFEVVANDGTVYLHDIIGDVCREAGLDPDEYDAMGTLPVVPVEGYAVTQPRSGREAISELQKIFPFDGFESGFKLKFNWVNQQPCLQINRGDLGARAQGDALPATDQMTLTDEFDLPKRYIINFQEQARGYSTNVVFALREVSNSNSVLTNEVTMTLTRAEAKTWAETQLALRALTRRSYKRLLPPKYIILEPGDVVQLPDAGQELEDPSTWPQSRLIEKNVGKNRIVEATFMDHVYRDKIVPAITDNDLVTFVEGNPPFVSGCYAFLMDLPLLTDTEADSVGFYAAIAGCGDNWPGGVLEVDTNTASTVSAFGSTSTETVGGTNYMRVYTTTFPNVGGFIMQNLSTIGKHPSCFDTESVVLFMMFERSNKLYSISPSTALSNAQNVALIGHELVQFLNATDMGNGLWKLDTFIRGLRGTEAAMGAYDAVLNPVGHKDSDAFLLLNPGGITKLTHDATVLNRVGTFRAETSGADPADAQMQTFADTGNSLRPRAPQILDGYKDDLHYRHLSWLPRCRQHGIWASGSTTQLDQASETYQIDVVQYGTVKATYSLSSVRSWTYTTAMMSTDGVYWGSAITLNLYEMGATIGRGFVSSTLV